MNNNIAKYSQFLVTPNEQTTDSVYGLKNFSDSTLLLKVDCFERYLNWNNIITRPKSARILLRVHNKLTTFYLVLYVYISGTLSTPCMAIMEKQPHCRCSGRWMYCWADTTSISIISYSLIQHLLLTQN